MIKLAFLVVLAALVSSCTMNGYRDESGKINLGPNATGDDPIHHAAYPSYAEYAVATHDLDEMKADGYSEPQQVCFARVLLGHLPPGLLGQLDDYATGKTILMESQYAALNKQAIGYTSDPNFVRPIKPELDRCLMSS